MRPNAVDWALAGWDGATAYAGGWAPTPTGAWLGLLASTSPATKRLAALAPTTTPPSVGSNGIEAGLIRGVLAERVIVSALLDPFLTLKALAAYSGIGLRKLYDFLSDPAHPLPHYRVGGKILVRRSEFDEWIAHYRQCGRADVDALVDNVLKSINSPCAS